MKKWIISLLVLVAFPVWAQFLPGTEDIPLMDGLINVEETASFDNPSERMVLVAAETKLSSKKVYSFYEQTLNNLGWQEVKPHYFKRGNDSFAIEITPSSSINQVQFRLSQSNT
ncbi:MAG: hypothetical protein IKQ99_02705 [Alphaproteobacteria bacterium]|nr:hypothetical protein [Alphaproteobacteria bacterium]